MFTGIVQAKAKVTTMDRSAFGARLTVDAAPWTVQPAHGDSICVSGVCLTVVEAADGIMSFDVIVQTLSKTTLGRLTPGDAVNLEASVTPSQPLGGHFMQGHVDGVGTVTQVTRGDDQWRITIQPPTELMDVIVPQGSIAVDGVSLTLASVTDDRFDVALIPTTLDLTTLGGLQVNDPVNLEGDILAKTVVHYLRRRDQAASNSPVTMEMLKRAGIA